MKNNIENIREELLKELVNILTYWENHTIDHDSGGFYGKINHYNHIVKDAPKGVVLNTRILWTFSAAYNHLKKKEYLQIASRAFEYIKDNFYDREYGGLIWEVDHEGNPLNTRKQIYAQGFGIYGFSEYFKASKDMSSLELAQSLFKEIELNSFDSEYGGYVEALNRDWSPLEDMRLSEKDANFPKSMNTHLHILEPYTNLYRVWKDDRLRQQIRGLIRVFLDRIINKQTYHFNLFFEMDWTVRSSIISYGHDIEGTWLLSEAALEIEDEGLLKEVNATAVKMTDAVIMEGLDKDGGIFYEKDGIHLDSDKHWWPQAEAMVGFINTWQITGDKKYLEHALNAWRFIKKNVLDKVNGEWFGRVNRSGVPVDTEDKAGFWKCPYHNSRACIEIINRLE